MNQSQAMEGEKNYARHDLELGGVVCVKMLGTTKRSVQIIAQLTCSHYKQVIQELELKEMEKIKLQKIQIKPNFVMSTSIARVVC